MPHVCFTLQVDPSRLDEYRARHRAVWPEMLAALREDGLLVGIVETDDLAAAQAAVDATEVSARWEAEMAPFFDLPGGQDGRDKHELHPVFDLSAQLRAAAEAPTATIGETP